jgi:hypothetical protein
MAFSAIEIGEKNASPCGWFCFVWDACLFIGSGLAGAARNPESENCTVLTLADAVSVPWNLNRELIATRFDSKASIHSKKRSL